MASYTSKNIETLRFPDQIRKNCGMYLGSTDEHGRWLIAREAMDNGLDEFLAGRNKGVVLVECKDGSYWVMDQGGGIPQGTKTFEVNLNGRNVVSKMPTMQAVFSEMHTSGKFRSDAYEVSVGSHGCGVKATNATSEFFDVYTKYNERWYSIGFKKGILTSPVKEINRAPKGPTGKALTKGTAIHFKPDASIFDGKSSINLKFAKSWAEITSYLNPGFTVIILEKNGRQTRYYSKEGSVEYVNKILTELKCSAETQRFVFKNELCDCVVAFSNAEGMNIRGYTNGLFNAQGGKHVDSVCAALLAAVKPYAKKKQNVTSYDIKEGLVGIVNMKLHKAEFSSQDKARLTDNRAGTDFEALLTDAFKAFFAKNKALAVRLCEKASKLGELRSQFKASKKVVQALNAVKRKGMPTKYAPADSRTKVEDRELLIVEGESASGGLREKRRPYQSLYPLRGKVINAAKNGDKALESEEVIGILGALGFDPKAKNPLDKLIVKKIICLADPDPDGCFDASVKVLMCDGTQKTFKELARMWEETQEPVWVWSLDEKGNLHPAQAFKASVRCMRDKYAVVMLDDGTKYKCTLNHPFAVNYAKHAPDLINNGIRYVYAKNLVEGDSITSAYSEKSKNGIPFEHKVVSVQIQTSAKAPYYCLTVPKYGNFLVADAHGNGVCSSNCHINSLLLTLFYKYLPQLFNEGRIYVADVPELYAQYKDKLILGDTLSEVQEKLKEAGAPKSASIHHIKGWGEIDASLMEVLAVNPQTRRLIQIEALTDRDSVEFVACMNDDVAFRRKMLKLPENA